MGRRKGGTTYGRSNVRLSGRRFVQSARDERSAAGRFVEEIERLDRLEIVFGTRGIGRDARYISNVRLQVRARVLRYLY